MRNKSSVSLGRMALAFIAVLAVAGPGLLFAQGPGTVYATPRIADILGPASVPAGGTATYQLEVIFSDNTRVTVPNPTFTARLGSFSGDTYTAPSPAPANGRDLLTGTFSNAQGSVRANRLITITP
ncbi:MAG TPA: hypothetical protein VFB38_01130 [Chthonomonadaceae bacterium]|nr:hypothetical protein [Chthonomonadaceae bacterium]